MTGEHPTPIMSASAIIGRERTAQNIFEKTANMDQLEANQIVGLRYGNQVGSVTYKINFHE